ncbi:MAG: hypothetical protein K2O54_05110 [Prevotella sp.]|nr:hypothetical protein [Prevotella sp.]
MSRKITMRGANALYTEHRTKGITDDGREIVMEGANVHYEELTAAEAPHFPLSNNEEEGKRLYRLLVEKNFIARDTSLDGWLYTMGYSMEQPMAVKPIVWLKNVQLAQVMLRGVFGSLIEKKELTVAAMSALAEKCFTKDGKPLRLAKFKTDPSTDSDLLENFFFRL